MIKAEVRKLAARKGIVALLGLPLLLVAFAYWGQNREVDYLRSSEIRALSLSREALREGGIPLEDFQSQERAVRENLQLLSSSARVLTFPASIQFSFQTLATGGSLFVALAAALAFGSEFSWGAYRNYVPLGRMRSHILLTQFTAFLAIVAGLITLAALIASVVGLLVGSFGGVAEDRFYFKPVGLVVSAGAVVLVLALWAALGLGASVLSRSAGISVAVTCVLWAGSTFVSLLLPAARTWNVETNAVALLSVDTGSFLSGYMTLGGFEASRMPSPWQAFGVLAALLFVLVWLSISRFKRMDLI